MSSGSQGKRRCSVCGSNAPHMPFGPDSCEWNPKFAQLANDKANTIEELVREVSQLSDRLSAETQRRMAAEAVVDAHWHENEAQVLADAYREKYPAESAMIACNIHEHDGAFKCFSHRRKWGAVLRPDDPCKGWVKP